MADLSGVNDTLPVRVGGVSSTSGLPDNYADVNAGGSLQVAGQGTAGTPAGGVVSVQGVSGGTALPVSQSGTWVTNLTEFGGTSVTIGQKAMAASIPVVLSSDQTGIPVTVPAGQETMANSLPVVMASNQSPFPVNALVEAYQTSSSYPATNNVQLTANENPLTQDAFGNLQTRGPALTDEGSFRDDFTGTSLTATLSGTVGFTNGSATVTGNGSALFETQTVQEQYIRNSTDGEADYTQISYVGANNSLFLDSNYPGTTNAAATGIVSNWATTTGSGSFTVANSVLSISSGTTSGNTTAITRDCDYLPISMNTFASISQRIANQTTIIGFVDDSNNPAAVVEFTGTTNTQVNFITAFSGQAYDQQTTTVTLPNGATTATSNEYTIDLSASQATLSVNGIVIATNLAHLPAPYEDLQVRYSITQTATVTATTVAIDSVYIENIDRLQITNDYAGEPMPVVGNINAGQADNNTASVKIGAIYNSSAPTYSTGQKTDIQTDANGNLKTVLEAAIPAGSNTIGAVTQASGPWTVQGGSASGATAAGNPVQIGGVFYTTQPTVTTGQSVEAQCTARGAQIVATGVDAFNVGNITGTVSLPTGASTSANQATEITLLQLIDNPVGSSTGGTAGSGSSLAGGIYNSTIPAITNGEQIALQVATNGALITTNVDGYKATYSANSSIGFASATSATDIFTITGSATKVVRITRIAFSAQETTAGVANVLLVKRSTANTGGTSTAATGVPHDSTSAAATATVLSYTVNPSALGTSVGTIRSARIFIPTSGTDTADFVNEWVFGFGPEQCIVLRGTTQVLALNLNSTTVTGGTWNCYVEWTEE